MKKKFKQKLKKYCRTDAEITLALLKRAKREAWPNGYKCKFNYAEVEKRIFANLAELPTVDIHRQKASEMFGCSLDAVTTHQRELAKRQNFHELYGGTCTGRLTIKDGRAIRVVLHEC